MTTLPNPRSDRPGRPSILETIAAEKRVELARVEAVARAGGWPPAPADRRDFVAGLAAAPAGAPALIAEIKRASPSAGVIRSDFDPVALARAYAAAGAQCLSVLTDVKFFQGSLDYLRQIRSEVALPLLRKDFIVGAAQIEESRRWGADAILLIVALLSDVQLVEFQARARDFGMAALVEVHDEAELDRAWAAGADLIGVNNRNLKTFEVDLGTTERLALRLRVLSKGRTPWLVAESGIRTRADVERLTRAGARAVLVGETLMRAHDLAGTIRELTRPLAG